MVVFYNIYSLLIFQSGKTHTNDNIFRWVMTEQLLIETFGKNIKRFRNRNGLSQEKLAEKIGVSKNTISDIETGKKFVHPKTLVKLALILNTEVYEFFKPEGILPDNSEDIIYNYHKDLMNMAENLKNNYLDEIKHKK